ncbi:MAG: tripartite tricarboxylate transporter TctB family protein [Acidisphaera sp.]|nr:tripartite tricarboxylate transporter TctB family protein [Acidisphaera sp.]
MHDPRRLRALGSAALGLLFLAGFAATLGMDGSLQYPIGYSQVLIVATGLLLFAAAALALREGSPTASAIVAGGPMALAATILLCLIYVLAWNVVGYFPATLLFVACQLWLLHQRRAVVLIGVPIGVTLIVYVVFARLLQLPFPTGMLRQ